MDDLRAAREAAHLTQREAAALAGVNLRMLTLFESGKRHPNQGYVRWLLRVYREGATRQPSRRGSARS